MPENLGEAVLVLSTKNKGLNKGIDTAQKKAAGLDKTFKGTTKQVGAFSSSMGGLVNPATLAAAALAGVGAGLLKIGKDSQQATKTIANATGATGKELELLRDQFDSTFSSVPDSMDTVAKAFSSLQTLTGESGIVLRELTVSVLDASRALGEDGAANASKFGKALKQFQVPAEVGTLRMDELFVATQKYDIGLGPLINSLNTYGSVLQNAGFSMAESAELFGRLSASGIEVSRVMPGLNKFFRDNAVAGRDSQVALTGIVKAMQEATSKTEALALATEAFGAEGAQRMTTAVLNGSFAVEGLGEALEGARGAVEQATEDNKTLGESFGELTNKVTGLVEPLAEDLVDGLTDVIDLLDLGLDSSKSWTEALGEANETTEEWSGWLTTLIPPLGFIQLATESAATSTEVLDDKIKDMQRTLTATAIDLRTTQQRLDDVARAEGAAEFEARKLAEAVRKKAAAAAKELAKQAKAAATELKELAKAEEEAATRAQSLSEMLTVMNDNVIAETAIVGLHAKQALDDLGGAIVNVGNTVPPTNEALSTLAADMGNIPKPAKEAEKALIQVSTIITDLSAGLADTILQGGSFIDVINDIGKALLRAFIESGIEKALKGIFGSLKDIFGFGGGGGGGGGGISIPGGVGPGGAAGAIAGMAGGGVVGLIELGVAVADAVIGGLQRSAMNKSLDLIVLHTLQIKNIVSQIKDDQLWRVVTGIDSIVGNTDNIKVHTWTIDDNLAAIRGLLQQGIAIVGETVDAIGEAVADSIGPVLTVTPSGELAIRTPGRGRQAVRSGGRGALGATNPNIGPSASGRLPGRSRGGSRAPFSQTGGVNLLGGFSGIGSDFDPSGRTDAVDDAPVFSERFLQLREFAARTIGTGGSPMFAGAATKALLAPLVETVTQLEFLNTKAESLPSMVPLLQTIAAKEHVINVNVSIDGKELTAHVLDGIRSELLLTPATVGF